MSETIERQEVKLHPSSKITVLGYSNEIRYGKGTYRIVTKTNGGFPKAHDIVADSPYHAFYFADLKKLLSISYISESTTKPFPQGDQSYNITLYARSGRKVWAINQILEEMTVGDINQDMSKTDFYNQHQYDYVNARSWSDKAFVQNS